MNLLDNCHQTNDAITEYTEEQDDGASDMQSELIDDDQFDMYLDNEGDMH